VGIVNAVEVVHAFRGTDGLVHFKRWLQAPDEALVELARSTASGGRGSGGTKGRGGKKGGRGRGRGAQQGGDEGSPGNTSGGGTPSQQQQGGSQQGTPPSQQQQQQQEGSPASPRQGTPAQPDEEAVRLAEFKRRHRGVRRNWEPPASFPNAAVDAAYAQPRVDPSKDK
jgi:hypothetical protein